MTRKRAVATHGIDRLTYAMYGPCVEGKGKSDNIIIQEQHFKGVPELTIKYGFFKN